MRGGETYALQSWSYWSDCAWLCRGPLMGMANLEWEKEVARLPPRVGIHPRTFEGRICGLPSKMTEESLTNRARSPGNKTSVSQSGSGSESPTEKNNCDSYVCVELWCRSVWATRKMGASQSASATRCRTSWRVMSGHGLPCPLMGAKDWRTNLMESGRWTPLWCGHRLRARRWQTSVLICTTPSSARL